MTRPTTFIDGTEKNIGDSIAANVEHKLSWRVSADTKIDIADMVMEVFAVEDGILPLELTTIPANGDNKAMELSWNCLTEAQVFDALLWLYADGDAELVLADGVLKHGDTVLANAGALNRTKKYTPGTTIYFYPAVEYVFSKMGFSLLTGDALDYANAMTRLGLVPGTKSEDAMRQYAYRWIEAR